MKAGCRVEKPIRKALCPGDCLNTDRIPSH